jgi:hypothetical protein
VILLTTGTKVQQTIASAESVLANLKTFSLETQDQNAKQMFSSLVQSQQTVVDSLNSRLQYIQNQEPQYKQQ